MKGMHQNQFLQNINFDTPSSYRHQSKNIKLTVGIN